MPLTPDRGISEALATERASRVRDLRYAIDLEIPADAGVPVAGIAVLSFDLDGDSRAPLLLDFAPDAHGRLRTCVCNETDVAPEVVNGHVALPVHALRRTNVVRLEFDAGDAPLNRRADCLYTVFVPARAHEALPCFDQPDLKGRFTLTLSLPGNWTAVANAAELPGQRGNGDMASERRTVRFADTVPIPTYLFAFAAGLFGIETIDARGRTFRVVHHGADADLLARNMPAIVDSHADALEWLTDYTDIPYPFGKLDVVLVPDFQFGGMEHPGAIFYNAGALLLDASATHQQLLARAHVIAHESAHMWFGDLVTMTWFSDVWMKEVFANLMAAKIVNPMFPDMDHDLRFFHAHHAAAYDVDRTAGAHPIRQPLDNLLDAGSLYGAIVYLKSPVVMRQLEVDLGETVLRDVLREYLRRYAYGNASWRDLLALLSARASFDVDEWSRAWVDEAGRPTIDADTTIVDGRVERLTLRQSDPDRHRALIWPQRFDIALGYGGSTEHVSTVVRSSSVDVDPARGKPAPDYVLPTGRGLAYGDLRLDERSRAWLTEHLPQIAEPLTRAVAWLALWDAMLDGSAAPASLARLATRLVAAEHHELNLQHVLASLDRLFWIFTPPHARVALAGTVESALVEALAQAGTTTMKAALFACLRGVATTDRTLDWLRAIWFDDARIEGLALSEGDRVALAQELAVRTGGDWIVQRQIDRTLSGERRARLMFVAPALSSEVRQRDRFFEQLADPANRRPERWAIEGLLWLHHPLRASAAVRYIAPGLELLEEIKRTGDIFLPKRWADATLGNHRSPDAAAAVRSFLTSRPASFPPALRRLVLASGDPLFRVADGIIAG